MARRKNEGKTPKTKVRQKKTKEVLVTPCVRLEPRLTPSPSKTCKSWQDNESEKDSMYYEGNISEEKYCKEDSFAMSSNEERNRTFNPLGFSETEESINCETSSQKIHSPKNIEIQKISNAQKMTIPNRPRRKVLKGFEWSDRESMDLATSLQTYGFSDTKKLADCVKTKNEADIKHFMKMRRLEICHNPNVKAPNRQGDYWSTLRPEHIKSWPNIRKWRKLGYEQMLLYTRSKDYSKLIIPALCQKFYDEEKEPADPQAINVKLIYKYLKDCMSGNIPGQLPPKESALVLDLLREVRSMPIAYDFEEERKFLQDFRSATRFKPFQIKDEFKKRYNKEPKEEFPPNTVAVPEEVFLELSRHKKLTQCFSPLVTPVWMLQKEQELLEKHAAESNVYVD